MKKILVMMALALSAIVAQAFEPYYYKFQVAGIKVTNENCDNITGSNIKSGTVKYLVSENTLVFTDVTIERTGSYNRALLNEGCNGLTVKFVGTNKLSAEDAAPLRLEINTTITCEAGGRVIVNGGDQDAVFVTKDAELFVKDADMTVTATSSSAFKGDGGKEIVRFSNSDVSATGSTAAVKDFYYVMAGGSYLFLSCTKTSNRVVNNLENLMLTSNMNYTVPAGAKFDSSQKTIVDSFNSPVKGEVYLTPVAPVYINNTTFPDINFRNYLLSTTAGSDSYLSGEEILGITSLNVMGKAINNLNGIEYLPRINTLYCSQNALTTVDLSKNTRLTYLEICYNNINGEGAENLVNNLPTVKKAEMWVYSQGSAGGRVDYNVFTPEQAATMETKGWIPLYYHKWLNLRVRFEGMTAYPIKVSKMFVHSLNSEDVLWDGAVNYQPEENVLTLDNATIYSEKQGIIADVEGLKIKVKGTNLIGTVSPTYTIDFEESQGVVLEGEEGSTLSLESSQHLSGIGLFTHQHIAEPGLTIRNCDITIPERGMIQNDNNDVPLIIDNSRIYINNGYIQTAPSLTLKNCHIAKPAGGRVEVYEIVGSDGKTWEGELEIVPGIDEYPLTIAGVKVTQENKDNLTQVLTDRGSLTSGSITFDGSTLTLTDAALKTYQSSGVGAILLDSDGQVLDDLTIDVQGTCTVEDMSVAGAGLVVGGAKGNSALNATLRFTGSGTLTLAGGGHGLSAYNCNSVKLLLNGPSVTMLTSQSTDGAAISSSSLERFDYEINAGRLTATGGADGYACVNQYSNDSQTASMTLASGVNFIVPATGATFGPAVHVNESGGYYLFYSVLDSDNKPVNTFTVGVPEYDLAVAGNKVTGANCGDILGDGKVVYDPEANTLTIANTTIDGGDTYALFSAVEGLKVVFTGENFLLAVGKSAVRLEASATFTGNNASCAAELGGNGAINVVKGTLTVKDMAQLTATNTRDVGIGINGAMGYNESGSLAYIPNLVIDNSRVEMTGTYACLAFFNDLRLTGCKVVTEGATWSASHGGMIDSSNRLFKGTLLIAPDVVVLRGDVNGDGVVSGADVTALYGYLLDGKTVAGDPDVSGEGVVSGADVTALYNLLLQ